MADINSFSKIEPEYVKVVIPNKGVCPEGGYVLKV